MSNTTNFNGPINNTGADTAAQVNNYDSEQPQQATSSQGAAMKADIGIITIRPDEFEAYSGVSLLVHILVLMEEHMALAECRLLAEIHASLLWCAVANKGPMLLNKLPVI